MKINKRSCLTVLVVTLGMSMPPVAQAEEKLPAGAQFIKIEARPAAMQFKTPFDYSQLILTGYLKDGDKVDVTRIAKIEPPANLVKISETGLARPVADGSGQLKITLADQTLQIPVQVAGQKAKYDVSFVRDIMPVVSKVGCNAGTCHGSAQGKNGFKLSLRGYDPVFDHLALTDDIEGRRFNRAAPEQSLMLLKPTGVAPHQGGVLFNETDPRYVVIREWISQGVKLDLSSPRVSKIDVYPKSPVIPLIGMKQQLAVIATIFLPVVVYGFMIFTVRSYGLTDAWAYVRRLHAPYQATGLVQANVIPVAQHCVAFEAEIEALIVIRPVGLVESKHDVTT